VVDDFFRPVQDSNPGFLAVNPLDGTTKIEMSSVYGYTDLFAAASSTGNEIVPKIIMNDRINLFLKTVISILLISNHNSFRGVLFDKIASVYFI